MNKKIELFFDGASDPNPGNSGIGYVIKETTTKILYEGKRNIGHATNNEAEFIALCDALEKAEELGYSTVYVYGDSKLIINIAQGSWKCRAEHLRKIREKYKAIEQRLHLVVFQWIPRIKNSHADHLSKEALKGGYSDQEKTRRDKSNDANPGKVFDYKRKIILRKAQKELDEGFTRNTEKEER